jgi:hypothetical protein
MSVFDIARKCGSVRIMARSTVLALAATSLLAATAMASFTISAKGGWTTTTGKPDSCSTSEWLFVINGISGGPPPGSIKVTFDAGSADVTLTFVETFQNPQASNAHYAIPITSANTNYTLDGATAVLQDGTTYNNFVLSHGSCAAPPPPPPPPPQAGTPELDSLILFGAGAALVGGFGYLRRRHVSKI